ncbi:type II secretion system F family protein, partial [Streptomyces sp. NPDC049577]|uniref:type II secretion system F family protein n=1 Tax=Streptomyces sp. NPDC049577 TaxID=3155153 RepID=UPI0034208E65
RPTAPHRAPGMALLCCALVAVKLLYRPGREARRVRLLFAAGGAVGGTGGGGAGPEWAGKAAESIDRLRRSALGRREWLCVPAGCAVALVGESPLPAIAGVAAVPLVRRWLTVRRRAKERARREAAVIDVCATVAGDLRAGRQPGEALAGLWKSELDPGWAGVPAAARFGGDVPGALREAARQPGAEGLNGVAACWRVAVDGGAGLATGLERVAAALGAERGQREELHAQLTGTRSTAVMLALLPFFALVMGSALGAAPLRVLLHTPAGLGCLLLGGLLECAGLVWTARIIRSAAGPAGGRKG